MRLDLMKKESPMPVSGRLSEVRRYAGILFPSMTPDLFKQMKESYDDAIKDPAKAKDRLTKETGQEVRIASYIFGESGRAKVAA